MENKLIVYKLIELLGEAEWPTSKKNTRLHRLPHQNPR